jgi:hypothetical protein
MLPAVIAIASIFFLVWAMDVIGRRFASTEWTIEYESRRVSTTDGEVVGPGLLWRRRRNGSLEYRLPTKEDLEDLRSEEMW